MKKEMLIRTFGVTMFISSALYFTAYGINDYKECHQVTTQEFAKSDTSWYYDGQILYPDYVLPDTMIVINARYLNDELILNKHGLVDGSDDSIWEMISESAVNIEDYPAYIQSIVKK